MFKRLFSVVLALALTVLFTAMLSSAASEISLSKTSVSLTKGYSLTLSVKGTESSVSWSSSDKSIATVSSSGKVVGKSLGTAYIYAKVSGKTLKCTVKVVAGKITADKTDITMQSGDKTTVTIKALGTHTISVSSSDKSVVKASWNGASFDGDKIKLTLTAVGAGTARIKVYAKNYSKSVYKYIDVTVNSDQSSDQSSSVDDYASQVLYYVNIERTKAGLSELTLDSTLCDAANKRAKEITQNLSHTRPDGTSCFTIFDEYGYSDYTAAENIAAGQTSAKEVVEAWMNSSGHRANILNSAYTKLGVGLVKTSSGYGYYWVQLFLS